MSDTRRDINSRVAVAPGNRGYGRSSIAGMGAGNLALPMLVDSTAGQCVTPTLINALAAGEYVPVVQLGQMDHALRAVAAADNGDGTVKIPYTGTANYTVKVGDFVEFEGVTNYLGFYEIKGVSGTGTSLFVDIEADFVAETFATTDNMLVNPPMTVALADLWNSADVSPFGFVRDISPNQKTVLLQEVPEWVNVELQGVFWAKLDPASIPVIGASVQINYATGLLGAASLVKGNVVLDVDETNGYVLVLLK